MKHYTTKYASKQAKDAKVKRDASKRRSNALGPAAIISDMDDVTNYTTHQQAIARQIEEYGDVLFA